MVVALVHRLLSNPAMAADAAQEAAVRALVGLSRRRSPDRFGAWYAGIALNTARRWLSQERPTTRWGTNNETTPPAPMSSQGPRGWPSACVTPYKREKMTIANREQKDPFA